MFKYICLHYKLYLNSSSVFSHNIYYSIQYILLYIQRKKYLKIVLNKKSKYYYYYCTYK